VRLEESPAHRESIFTFAPVPAAPREYYLPRRCFRVKHRGPADAKNGRRTSWTRCVAVRGVARALVPIEEIETNPAQPLPTSATKLA
jgi:hypothetical protein